MKEIVGNIFEIKCDAICITTNGFVKKNGTLVMGRGVARQATIRFHGIEETFGDFVKKHGNHVNIFRHIKTQKCICSFPVKHNWYENADIDLIVRSAKELVKNVNRCDIAWNKILLPKPGCGNGQLEWKDVKKAIASILDDRFYIIDLK